MQSNHLRLLNPQVLELMEVFSMNADSPIDFGYGSVTPDYVLTQVHRGTEEGHHYYRLFKQVHDRFEQKILENR